MNVDWNEKENRGCSLEMGDFWSGCGCAVMILAIAIAFVLVDPTCLTQITEIVRIIFGG